MVSRRSFSQAFTAARRRAGRGPTLLGSIVAARPIVGRSPRTAADAPVGLRPTKAPLLVLLGHKILTGLKIVLKGYSVNRDGCCPGADPDRRGDLQACLDCGGEQAANGSQLPRSA
jgi:hypothetical protein